MGAYLDKFNEANEDAEKNTPTKISKMLHQKRLLSLDPRSPSEGITRTPIIVEKTPVPASSRDKMFCIEDETPKVIRTRESIKDPRSPSNEFTRTPINGGMLLATRKLGLSPLVAEFNSPSSPVSAHTDPESGIESTEVSPVFNQRKYLADESEEQLHSPDSALSCGSWGCLENIQHLHDKQQQDAVDCENFMYVDDDDDEEIEDDDVDITESPPHQNVFGPSGVVFPTVTPTLSSSILTSRPTQDLTTPKLSQFVKKNGPLVWSQGTTRSPLSAVDNSISLVQRKNIMPSGGKQLVKYSGVDKENIFH